MPRAELVWGVKSSLTRYVQQLGDGRIEGRAGAVFGNDGVFRLPLRHQDVDGENRTMAFDGEIRLEGHGGLLLIRLAGLQIETTRDAVVLTAMTDDHREPISERRAVAVLAARTPDVVDGVEVWSGVPTRLTQAGAEVLGQLQYYATLRVDDLTYSAPERSRHPLPQPPRGRLEEHPTA